MFGALKKLQGVWQDLANSSLKAENKDVMEAMVASGTLVAYASNGCDESEMKAIANILKTSEQLKVFGNEPTQLFDKYCDKMEASARMGKLDLMKEIGDMTGHEDAPRVLIMAIDVAYADGECDADETAVLEAIASKLGLRLSDFL